MGKSITSKAITDGQKKQYNRLVEDSAKRGTELALKKVSMDTDGCQRVFKRGDELRTAIAEVIVAKTRELSVSNLYADEEVRSSCTYPKEYKGSKPIERQVELLLKYFPGLDPEPTFRYMRDVYQKLNIPKWVEGPFIAPNEHALAEKFYPEVDGRQARYCAGVNLVLKKIGESRQFYNYRDGEITPDRFRMTARTAEKTDILIDQQNGADIIIYPAQVGLRYRGCSVRRARELFIVNEFGLGSLVGGSIALINPERFFHWEELDMDCSGDEFAPVAGGGFSHAPCFGFRSGKVRFGANGVGCAYDYVGSASAFLPQLKS